MTLSTMRKFQDTSRMLKLTSPPPCIKRPIHFSQAFMEMLLAGQGQKGDLKSLHQRIKAISIVCANGLDMVVSTHHPSVYVTSLITTNFASDVTQPVVSNIERDSRGAEIMVIRQGAWP